MGAVAGSIDQALADMLELRIALAQCRDNLLTESELVAKLDVCAEFGR